MLLLKPYGMMKSLNNTVAMLVDPEDYLFEIPPYSPYIVQNQNGVTTLVLGLDDNTTIADLARIELVYGYDEYVLGGSSRLLYSHWSLHGPELMDLSPLDTYTNVMLQAKVILADTTVNPDHGRCCQMLTMVDRRRRVASFYDAKHVTGDVWTDRYERYLAGEDIRDELKAALLELDTENVLDYYQNLPKATEVYTKYRERLARVIAGE